MNTTNATAETPEQWAQRVAQDVLDRDYWGKDRPRLAAELASVKAQADRAAAQAKALKHIIETLELDSATRPLMTAAIEIARTALSQTGGQK